MLLNKSCTAWLFNDLQSSILIKKTDGKQRQNNLLFQTICLIKIVSYFLYLYNQIQHAYLLVLGKYF